MRSVSSLVGHLLHVLAEPLAQPLEPRDLVGEPLLRVGRELARAVLRVGDDHGRLGLGVATRLLDEALRHLDHPRHRLEVRRAGGRRRRPAPVRPAARRRGRGADVRSVLEEAHALGRLRDLRRRLAHLLAQLVGLDRGALQEVVDLVDVVATEAESELGGAQRVERARGWWRCGPSPEYTEGSPSPRGSDRPRAAPRSGRTWRESWNGMQLETEDHDHDHDEERTRPTPRHPDARGSAGAAHRGDQRLGDQTRTRVDPVRRASRRRIGNQLRIARAIAHSTQHLQHQG